MAEPSAAERLASIAASMKGVFQKSEQMCLQVGEGLGTTLDAFGRLSDVFKTLPATLEGEALRGAHERLSHLATKVKDIGTGLSQERAALSRLTALSQKITSRVERLRSDIRTIAALTINAKVEARSIDAGGDDLNSFIDELTRLAGTAQGTIEDFWHEHEKLIELLKTSSRAQLAFESSHQAKLFKAAQEVRESLATLSARCTGVCNSAGEISARSTRISQAIGQAVMALQVGDSTRQRIEHADAGLGEIAACLNAHPAAAGAGSAGVSSAQHSAPRSAGAGGSMTASAACRLQAMQIEQALNDFESEMDKICGSLAELSDQARDMVDFGAKIYGGTTRADESFVGTLRNRLGIAVVLVQEASAERTSVDRVMAAAVTTLSALEQRVRTVSGIVVDMTLIGMNGILKSVRVGNQGKGLSVIAQELRNYANQVIEGVEHLKPALQQVIDAAGEFEANKAAGGREGMAEVERQMADALQAVQKSGTEVSEALHTLAQEGAGASAALDRSAADLGRNEDLRNHLNSAIDELDEIAHLIVAEGTDPSCDALVPLFARRYTMAAEREIHAVALRGGYELAAA